jgi:hypothetical protein
VNYLENELRERQLRDGEYDKTILVISSALVKYAAREESLIEAMRSRHGADADRRALTARPDPRKTGLTTRGGPSKEPCPRCGKPHPWSKCFQNDEADERTLELASRIAPSSPAGKTFRARHPKTTQRRNGGEHSAVAMRASGRGNTFDIDTIAETLGPLALKPASAAAPLQHRALCAISRQLDIGGAPIAAAERADAIDAGVHGFHFDNYFADAPQPPPNAPQPPEPRTLRTATRRMADPSGHELRLTIDSGASFHVVNNPHYLINTRPTDETISGVDRRDHACTLIGDMPIVAKDEMGVSHRLTIRHVRCVPTISDSLLSILKLWDDEGSDCRFKDVNAIQTSSGLSFPFQREHGGTGLGMWTVQVQPRQRLT